MDPKEASVKLPKQVYEDALNEIIFKKLGKSIEEFDVIYSPGSSKGDNYIGVLYRIQVNERGTDKSVLKLIAKFPPESEITRAEMSTEEFFKREADFYENVFPLYKKFQLEKGIDIEKEGFSQVPLCYKILSQQPNEGLFLEDLKHDGFEMFDRFKEVTKEQVELVMKALAKMHAVFYAIKDQNPPMVESYFTLVDIFIQINEKDNSMTNYYSSLLDKTLDVVNKSENTEMKEKIKNYLKGDPMELCKSCFDLDKIEPYAVLCHGDCWNNNMLFRYDENGVPNDLRLLDFQIMRYASPVCDLLYYIFGSTTKSLRDKYYNEFMNVYYSELSSFIQRLGSDPDKVFPRNVFDQHLKDFGHFGFLMAIMILPIFTGDVDDIPDMEDFAKNLQKMNETGKADKDALSFTSEKTYDKFVERMLGVCEDMCSLGYI